MSKGLRHSGMISFNAALAIVGSIVARKGSSAEDGT